MSLFAGEQPQLGVFSTVGAPIIAVPQVAPATGSGAGINLVVPIGTLNLANAVTLPNPTTATALMTYKFPAGSLNQLNRIVDIFAAGNITPGTSSTATFAVTLNDGTNTRTVATWTTAAIAAIANMPWEFDLSFYISTAGSSAKAYGHGIFSVPVATSTVTAVNSYNDTNTAATSTFDATQLITLSVTALFGTTNAGNSVVQDMMQISLSN